MAVAISAAAPKAARYQLWIMPVGPKYSTSMVLCKLPSATPSSSASQLPGNQENSTAFLHIGHNRRRNSSSPELRHSRSSFTTQPYCPSAAANAHSLALAKGSMMRKLMAPSSDVACRNSSSRILRAKVGNR